jgi:hypothetical protein
MGDNANAWCHETTSLTGFGTLIAANVQMADGAGVEQVIGSESGHAQADDEVFARHGQFELFNDHSFLVGAIESLDQDLSCLKNPAQIPGIKSYGVLDHPHQRVNAFESGPQRGGFGQADLIDEIVLPVQITGFNDVEIGDDKGADTDPGQGDSDIRAQAAAPGDADNGLFQATMDPRAVPTDQGGFQFRHWGNFPAPDQNKGVPGLDPGGAIHREAVQDEEIRAGLHFLSDFAGGCVTADFQRSFIDQNLHAFPSLLQIAIIAEIIP